MQYGLGDTELGVKYRFIQDADRRPQVGTFPLIELQTSDSRRGLGESRIRVFLPLWLQKSWGPWTAYGGGGYWFHPGSGNEDYWFFGWLLQREIFKGLTAGAEVLHETKARRVARAIAGSMLEQSPIRLRIIISSFQQAATCMGITSFPSMLPTYGPLDPASRRMGETLQRRHGGVIVSKTETGRFKHIVSKRKGADHV